MNHILNAQQTWLEQRISELLPGFSFRCESDGNWSWTGIYWRDVYCGGYGFYHTWFRVDVPVSQGGSNYIPCSVVLRQRVRLAVNRAIAELAEQQQAA